MKNPETLEKLCEIVDKRLEMAVDELSREGGKLSMDDARYLDLLTHTQKSIKTTMAMEGYGNSERRGRDSMGRYISRDGGDGGNSGWGYYPRAWDDGGSYRSYRGSSYEGRSMHGEDVKAELRELMEKADDERVRRALHTAMQQM
ncbi:MAG: hypothetical protein J6S60_07360 [Oscillospiraceae bacterium]|nr:hypothetical protein [Oscillospiraceae bacterium]